MDDAIPPPPPPPLADPQPPRGVGRPRDRRLDIAVLAATRELLVEVGYHQLSIEAVARRARVHRPVIYRRWRSKAELVHDAVFSAEDAALRIVESGTFADDLRACVHNSISLFCRAEVLSAFPGLMAAQRTDPDLRHVLRPRLEVQSRADFERLLRRAVSRGEARPAVAIDTLFDVLAGAIVFHMATLGTDDLDRLESELFAAMKHLAGVDRVAERPGKTPARRAAGRPAGKTVRRKDAGKGAVARKTRRKTAGKPVRGRKA